MAELAIEQRRDILDKEVRKYVGQGYRVVARTDTTAQLVKPKKFSLFWFLVWALLIVGWIFYVAWYLAKRDETVYLEVAPDGKIKRR
jgi:hypothetical protein